MDTPDYKDVQSIAKKTIEYIKSEIEPYMNLREVRDMCEKKMRSLGADSFWYWDVGALVFSGDETAFSVSGKNYTTSDKKIEENDIVTIDLSPECGNIWGDFARTIIIENGMVVRDIENIKNEEWKNGLGTALTAYAAGTGSWDDVVSAFVDGWATEKALSE